MRLMQYGTATALASLIFFGSVTAQESCTCSGTGADASGSAYPTLPVSEPLISQTVVTQPLATEFVASSPVLGGISQDQPIITGEVIMPATAPPFAPIATGEVITSEPPSAPAAVVTGLPAMPQVLPYSYWVLAPNPSRIYVEYGQTDQFPYHGRAYGNPSDRWSWYYMGGGDSRYLAKYYYPILQ